MNKNFDPTVFQSNFCDFLLSNNLVFYRHQTDFDELLFSPIAY